MPPGASRSVCPHCAAEVPRGALACRECGSDAQTGWADPDEIQYEAAFAHLPDVLDPDLARPRPAWPSWRSRGWRIACVMGGGLAAAAFIVLVIPGVGVPIAVLLLLIVVVVSVKLVPQTGGGSRR